MTAANIVLVSKNVRGWITPLLYEIAILQTSNSVVSFYETIQVQKSCFASHIRELYLPSPPSPDVPPSFLTNFPALQHLAISGISLRDPPHPSLLRISPCPTSITITGPRGRISFEHPIFKRCTYLYLADDVPAPFALTAKLLPCLTHLACAYIHGSSSVTAVTCLPLLLAQKPSGQASSSSASRATLPYSRPASPVELKALVVELYLSDGNPDATMFVMERLGLGKKASESDLRADPRLVLRPGKALTPQRWKNYVTNNVLWSGVEREIRLQRCTESRIHVSLAGLTHA
jgi:hypothetical protein